MKIIAYDRIYVLNETKKLQNIKKWIKEEKSAKGAYIYDVHTEGWYERRNGYWKLAIETTILLFIYANDGVAGGVKKLVVFYARDKCITLSSKNKISGELDYKYL